jgi:uncharacterized damage-inducible protein DinB
MAKKSKPKAKPKAKATPKKSPKNAAAPDPGKEFLQAFAREHATTVKVLRAYPADKLDLQPHAKCKTARDLAWMTVMEQGMLEVALTTGFDWSKPMTTPPPAPATMDEIVAALEQAYQKSVAHVSRMKPAQFQETIKFPVAPRTVGDVPKIAFLWMLLSDQIHHRGQFSIYLRMADGKVPSIYGPTADEPWF